jgi:hypothetical protein
MGIRSAVAMVGNFVVVAGLIAVGFRLFAQYHARGRWAKNITALLAGAGMLGLAVALLITPQNANVIVLIAKTNAYFVVLVLSNLLLLAAIAAFGIINYWRPARLQLERKIEKDLRSELPNVD